MDMMPQNVLRIVKQLKLETLPKTVQYKEDSSNVASGKVMVGFFGISDFLIQDLNFLLVMLYIGGWPPSKGTKLQIYVTGRSFKLQFVTLAPLSQDSQQAANFCHRPVTNLKFFVTGRAPSYTFFSQARHQTLNLWHLHFVTSQTPDSPCTSRMCIVQ